jgi:hypothetical protein
MSKADNEEHSNMFYIGRKSNPYGLAKLIKRRFSNKELKDAHLLAKGNSILKLNSIIAIMSEMKAKHSLLTYEFELAAKDGEFIPSVEAVLSCKVKPVAKS